MASDEEQRALMTIDRRTLISRHNVIQETVTLRLRAGSARTRINLAWDALAS